MRREDTFLNVTFNVIFPARDVAEIVRMIKPCQRIQGHTVAVLVSLYILLGD